MEVKTTYVAYDGEEFSSAEAAEAHEELLKGKAEKAYQAFLKTYAGRRLLSNHSLNEEGIWKITGEDGNPDFGGARRIPNLGTVEGRLEDVIRYAVKLTSFWSWGAGGDITKTTVKKIKKVGPQR